MKLLLEMYLWTRKSPLAFVSHPDLAYVRRSISLWTVSHSYSLSSCGQFDDLRLSFTLRTLRYIWRARSANRDPQIVTAEIRFADPTRSAFCRQNSLMVLYNDSTVSPLREVIAHIDAKTCFYSF